MATQETMDAAESTLEVIEGALDHIDAVETIIKNNPVVIAGVAVISVAVGAGVTAYFARSYFKKKYEAVAAHDIEEAKVFYSKLHKEGEYSDPVSLSQQLLADQDEDEDEPDEEEKHAIGMVQDAIEIMKTQEYVPYNDIPEPQSEEEVVEVTASIKKKNLFENRRPTDEFMEEFVIDDELDKQRAGLPYIVEHDQFYENEDEYVSSTITYYEGDGVLEDEDGDAITNVDRIIGGIANIKFGYGSKDKNTVLIFNDELRHAYEVIRDTGSYTKDVLGFDDEDDAPRQTRFRNED